MKAGPGPISDLILDLRGNSGGLLQEALTVADHFVGKGLLVRTRSRAEPAQDKKATPGGVGESIPLAVLVNSSTASGAEIVAGAIQGNGRGLILGERTFGKGTVQVLYPAGGGACYIKLTCAFFPGRGIVESRTEHRRGVARRLREASQAAQQGLSLRSQPTTGRERSARLCREIDHARMSARIAPGRRLEPPVTHSARSCPGRGAVWGRLHDG